MSIFEEAQQIASAPITSGFIYLAVPLALIALLALTFSWRNVSSGVLAVGLVLLIFSLLAFMSVGLTFLPLALLFLVSGIAMRAGSQEPAEPATSQ